MSNINLILWAVVIVCMSIRFLYVVLALLKVNNTNNDEGAYKLSAQDALYFIAGFIMYACIIALCIRAFIA